MERPRQEAEARNAKESLDMAFQMSNILDPALDRHTLSLLVALCDCGVNPESLAALVRDFSLPTPSATSVAKENYFHRLRPQP